jgi:hypothetical protein
MNTITSSWTRRIAAGATLAAASALIALGAPAASHADATPSPGMGCETIHWGFLGGDRRQICDGAKQADGTWQRTRTIFTPAYIKPLTCNGTPGWPFGSLSPSPGPSPNPAPSPDPDPDFSSDTGSASDAGFSSMSSHVSNAGFSSMSSGSTFASSLSCTGGYPVPQSTQSQETYTVAPNNVLPDEPGWLPPGTNNIL